MTVENIEIRLQPLVAFSYSNVPLIELAMTSGAAATCSGWDRISTASMRFTFPPSSSHFAARSNALTIRTVVFGFSATNSAFIPKTFSGLFLQMLWSAITGTPTPPDTAC